MIEIINSLMYSEYFKKIEIFLRKVKKVKTPKFLNNKLCY